MQPTTLAECAQFVKDKEPFEFNHVRGVMRHGKISDVIPPTYTVYSFSIGNPLYVYDYEACQWFGNSDEGSEMTELHKKTLQPHSVAQWVDTRTLDSIAIYGIVGTSAQRME